MASSQCSCGVPPANLYPLVAAVSISWVRYFSVRLAVQDKVAAYLRDAYPEHGKGANPGLLERFIYTGCQPTAAHLGRNELPALTGPSSKVIPRADGMEGQ